MKQAPVAAGETYEVEAVRLNDDGEGVVSVHGFTLFVPGLLPGECAAVTVQSVEKRFGRATLNEGPSRASTARETALCSVFGDCGGCQLQHLNYTEQLHHKRDMVENTLKRLGKFSDVQVLPTVGMDEPWRYRNQIQVPLAFDAETGRLRQGFFAAGSHRLVVTDRCHLATPAMEDTVRHVVNFLEHGLADAAAGVHHLVVRESHTTAEQMVILCVRDKHLIPRTVVASILNLQAVVSVAQTVQPRPHGPIWGPSVDILAGQDHLTERMGGLEYLISPRSFFQVNTVQAARLYELAVACADLQPEDHVLDAYCGTGTMTLLFAQRAKHVLGIESVPAAIADAEANATHNHVRNAEFVVGNVEDELPARLRRGERFDVVVLDPPRRGCHPDVLRALAKAKPRRIVYVSCNHVTFARDARQLADSGYDLGSVQPVDMFPQTSHVECCSLFVRNDR